MAKRFTCTEKWDRPWFRRLPLEYKIFWYYICDKCDLSGVWYADFEVASFMTGGIIEKSKAEELFNKQIELLQDGTKWYIKDFVRFQYGNLVPNNNLHRSVISLLEKNDLAPKQPLTCPSAGAKVRVRVRVKDIEGVIGGDFEEIWSKYPNKDGRKAAEKAFNGSVRNEQDWKDINIALDNYLRSDKVQRGFIKNGSTFFNNWRDWIAFVDTEPQDGMTPRVREFLKNTGGKTDGRSHSGTKN